MKTAGAAICAGSLLLAGTILTQAQERDIVRDAIVALCRAKAWRLLAAHVRSNHVHIVVAVDREAHSIFIFGPGEAKEEFKKRLEQDGLGGLIDEVAVVGRMSDRQIAAKVHDHFRPRV